MKKVFKKRREGGKIEGTGRNTATMNELEKKQRVRKETTSEVNGRPLVQRGATMTNDETSDRTEHE